MKPGSQSPRSQCMKQHGVGVGRFIGIVFVPQFVALVTGLSQFCQFRTQSLDLNSCENLRADDETITFVVLQLFVRQSCYAAGLALEQIGNEIVGLGKIRHRGNSVCNGQMNLKKAGPTGKLTGHASDTQIRTAVPTYQLLSFCRGSHFFQAGLCDFQRILFPQVRAE